VNLFVPDVLAKHVMAKQPAMPKGIVVAFSRPRLSRMPAHTLSFVFVWFRALRAACGVHVILGQHHYYHMGSFCAAVLSIITRRPLVIRVHDFGGGYRKPTNVLESVFAFGMKWLTLLSFKRAEQVLVPSDELVHLVRRVCGLKAGAVRLSLNGVDTKRFSPSRRSNDLRNVFRSKHIVVFTGNIDLGSDASGLDILVRAAEYLRGDIHDLKVLILGDGPDLPHLIRLANSLHLDHCVNFLGWIDPELIPTYLASADVAVGLLRANIETIGSIPVKVVEYMASGCVVVVARGGCSKNLIIDGTNGIVTEPDSVTDFAQSIIKIFSNDKLTRRLRSKARETAQELYDWEVIVSELEDALRSAAETH
jgi:glycosyltransferase involved in cell wall biosynthesis